MSKKIDMLEELRKRLEKFERERKEIEEFAAKVREQMAEAIPRLQAEIAEIDKKIAALQEEKKAKLEQLRLLGIRVGRPVAGRRRAGGLRDMLAELVRTRGVGAVLTKSEITEYLGTASGYVGMLIKEYEDKGILERIAPGQYKVIGVP